MIFCLGLGESEICCLTEFRAGEILFNPLRCGTFGAETQFRAVLRKFTLSIATETK